MVVLVGIDEAGFGPILGPLIVSSSTFSVPHNLLTSDMWQVLRKSVGDRRKYLAGRLLITDSKKAYSRSSGIKHLQRTVLTALKCLGKEPSTLTEFVELMCPDCLCRLSAYPWYQDIANHAFSIDIADKEIASVVLADDLASNGIELLDLRHEIAGSGELLPGRCILQQDGGRREEQGKCSFQRYVQPD